MSNSRNFSTLASNVSSGGSISTNVLIGALANSASSNTVYLQGVVDYQNTTISNVNSFAQSAYNSANNVAPQVQPAFTQANNALILAQGAFDSSNTVSNYANGTNSLASSAYNQANTATTNASNANILAQNAYNNSNTKFSSSGGIVSGNVSIGGSLQIDANLTVGGTVTTINANNLSIIDNMIYLNRDANVANPDIGIAGAYNDGTYHHTGFFRDATDGVWKVFDNYQPEPDASPYIDTSNSSFRIADFQANNITAQSISLSRDFKLPVGNTAQRPPSSAGKLYFNNETNKFEGYGTSWGSIGGGALIGDTPPSNPSSGDLWWNSSDGKTYIYYGTTWVQAQPGGDGQYLPLTGGTVTGNITNVGTLTSNNIVSTANVTYSGILTGGTGIVNIGSGQIYKDASGNVGIGTSSPVYKLTVAGKVSYNGAIGEGADDTLSSSGTTLILGGSATWQAIQLRTGNTERIRIDSSGNVGIGTNTIGSGLDVVKSYTIDSSGATNKWTARFRDSTAYATGVGGSLLFQGIKSSGGSVGNFAGIAGLKENATDNNEQGYLSFYTTPSSGVITERGRFDSTGSLVLGPSASRFAHSAAAGDIVFNNGLTDTPGIQFQYANNSNFGIDSYSDGTNQFLRFVNDINQVGGSQNINFSRTGVINLGGRMIVSGSGIAFPQTQSASSDANTLDDYEEGTWTPNISGNNGTGSFTVKIASYVKIGRQVTCWFVCDGGSSNAGGSTQYLSGLPFTIGSIQTNTTIGHMGTNGPATRSQQLMTLSANRNIAYIYVGGSQEATAITFASGFLTYWID